MSKKRLRYLPDVNPMTTGFQKVCLAYLVLLPTNSLSAQDITYHVVPINVTVFQTGEIYAISGTITTNGRIGALTPGDIVSYNIEASGQLPYTFTPSNPGSEVTAFGGVEATANDISFVSPAGFGFVAFDNTEPNCQDCRQSFGWMFQGLTTAAFYSFRDQFDGDPFISPSSSLFPLPIAIVPDTIPGDYDGSGLVGAGDLGLVLGGWGTDIIPPEWVNQIPMGTVGAAELSVVLSQWGNSAPPPSVPEPSSVALLCLGWAAFMRQRR